MALHKKTFEELSAHPDVAVKLGKQINSYVQDTSRTTRAALAAMLGKTSPNKIISTRKDQAHKDLIKLEHEAQQLNSHAKADLKENVVNSLNPVIRSGLKHIDVSRSISNLRHHLEEHPAPAAATGTPQAPATASHSPHAGHTASAESGEKKGVVNWVKTHPIRSAAAATLGLGVLGSGSLASAGTLASGAYQSFMSTPAIGGLAHSVINGGSLVLNGAGNVLNSLTTNIPVLKAIPSAISAVSTSIANYTGLSSVIPASLSPWAGGILGLTAIGAIKRARERARGQKNKEYKNILDKFVGTTFEGVQFIGSGVKTVALSPLTLAGWGLSKIQTVAENTWKTTSKFTTKQLAKLKPTKYGVAGGALGGLVLANFFAPGIAVAPFIWGAGGYLAGNYFARHKGGEKVHGNEGAATSHDDQEDHDGDGHGH